LWKRQVPDALFSSQGTEGGWEVFNEAACLLNIYCDSFKKKRISRVDYLLVFHVIFSKIKGSKMCNQDLSMPHKRWPGLSVLTILDMNLALDTVVY
jgi:hypothetical protein